MKTYTTLDLHLFDGEAGTAAPAPEGDMAAKTAGRTAWNPLEEVAYGKQAEPAAAPSAELPSKPTEATVDADTEEARRAEFERLIKGKYRDLYEARTQRMINDRFKQTKGLEEQVNALAPVLELLADKYGVDPKDAKAVAAALEEDDSYYQDEAYAKGVTVEQLKTIKKLERENAAFREMAKEQERRQRAGQIYAQWEAQAQAAQALYPGFDLREEINRTDTGERFMGLLRSGVDARTAYEVVHKDEIIGGAMQYTAQRVQEKVVNDIRARGMRPPENGGSGAGAARIVKSDPSAFTKKDRDEIARRVMRGERIEL